MAKMALNSSVLVWEEYRDHLHLQGERWQGLDAVRDAKESQQLLNTVHIFSVIKIHSDASLLGTPN